MFEAADDDISSLNKEMQTFTDKFVAMVEEQSQKSGTTTTRTSLQLKCAMPSEEDPNHLLQAWRQNIFVEL